MSHELNRRSFIVTTGLTALAATRVLGANDTLRVGVIGAGGRMGGLLASADAAGGYQIAAVSDVYAPHRDAVQLRSNGLAAAYPDYRRVLDEPLDAVLIAAPDHWHVRMALDALSAGKDVYLEKPVTHTLEEGGLLTRAVRSGNRILQCGMQQRSWSHFRDAVELIQVGSSAVFFRSGRTGGKTISRTRRASPLIRRFSTGSSGSAALLSSPSMRKSFIAGAGIGISVAAP